ncbi:hypothetical protein H5410_003101, partial [Solanum commersonii]
IYVTQAQSSATPTPIVDPYELLEKEWKTNEEEYDKEMSARVRPLVDENEMKDIFIKAQDNMYYERMLLMTGSRFIDWEALEEGTKSG